MMPKVCFFEGFFIDQQKQKPLGKALSLMVYVGMFPAACMGRLAV
jgi:hypothetical protein